MAHDFMLHETPCPNPICLGRDLAEAADVIVARGGVMKPYLVFAGNDYYPAGGWSDFRSSFDNINDATAEAERLVLEPNPDDNSPQGDGRFEWAQVVDLATSEGTYIQRSYAGKVSRGPIWRGEG